MNNIVYIGERGGTYIKYSSSDDAGLLQVEHRIDLHHTGDAYQVVADHGGLAAVSLVLDHTISRNSAQIRANVAPGFNWAGSYHGGENVLFGDADLLVAKQMGRIILYGNAKKVTASNASKVAIISTIPDYEPDEVVVDRGQGSEVYIITPSVSGKPIDEYAGVEYPPFRSHALLAELFLSRAEVEADIMMFEAILQGSTERSIVTS